MFSKKQNSVAPSTTEAEYVATDSCCAQILWIKHQLEDYSVKLDKLPIRCDNNSTINLSKNSILHSRTKYIDVLHHFIREQVLNDTVFLDYVSIKNQITDIFTKPLNEEKFCDLRRELGIFDPFS